METMTNGIEGVKVKYLTTFPDDRGYFREANLLAIKL